MPVWHDNRWKHVNELYQTDKEELKKVIREIVSMDFSEFDQYDNTPLRTWMLKRTKHEGIIALFEFISMIEVLTDEWYDHSAIDNLYVRKMHYGERRIGGFSFFPKGGFQIIFDHLADVIRENGGTIELNTRVRQIVVNGAEVNGVELEIGPRLTPNDLPDVELVKAPFAICTLPVWNIFEILDPDVLPDWYTNQIRTMALEENKACWIGFYAASEEPVYALSEKELTAWFHAPRTGFAGFSFSCSSMDPSVVPDGKHLFVCGGVLPASEIKNKRSFSQAVSNFEKDMEEMFPKLKQSIWKRWHVIHNPAFGLLGKPGLSGGNRPENKAPNIEGLYFAGDTVKSRGIGMDRSARSALTCVELILGDRLQGLEKTWRY